MEKSTAVVLHSFKLPAATKDKIRERTRINGKKMYFYAAELIEKAIEMEDINRRFSENIT